MTPTPDRTLADGLRETARVLGMPSLLPAAAALDAQARRIEDLEKTLTRAAETMARGAQVCWLTDKMLSKDLENEAGVARAALRGEKT